MVRSEETAVFAGKDTCTLKQQCVTQVMHVYSYDCTKYYYWEQTNYKLGLVFPSGTNRTLACSERAQDISV